MGSIHGELMFWREWFILTAWLLTGPTRDRIKALKREYDALRRGKESLLAMIDEVGSTRERLQLERDRKFHPHSG